MPKTAPASVHPTTELLRESSLWSLELHATLQKKADTALEFLLSHHPNHIAQTFSLVLADNACLQDLNAQWRDKNQPTNVLAFPAAALPNAMDGVAQTLGDVLIAFETAQKEAGMLNIDLAEHSTHLMVHGLLHLLGHDHLCEAERLSMENWEIRTLEILGYHNPYE